MRINNLGKTGKNNASKLFMNLYLAIALVAGLASSAQAQSGIARQQAETGITTYRYSYKSNAIGKLNAEKKRGKFARMYYDNARQQWAVDVGNGLTSTTRTTTVRTPQQTTASAPRTGSYIYYYGYKSNAEGKLRAERNRGRNARMFYDNGRRKWAVQVGNNLPTGTSTVRTQTVTTAKPSGGSSLPSGATTIYFPTRASAEGIYKSSLRQGDWAKMWYDAERREWAVAIKPGLRR